MSHYEINAPELRPGTVIPHPNHDGEWTFYFFINGKQTFDYEENPSRSYKTAWGAKAAMRVRCGIS